MYGGNDMDKRKDGEMWNITLAFFAEEYGRDSDKYKNMKRAAKKSLNRGDDYEWDSMIDSPRSGCGDDNWDTMVQYGFFDGHNKSDADVREFIDEYIRIRPPYSPYDCTGRPFTMYVHWHRNPSGLISFVNHIGLDV